MKQKYIRVCSSSRSGREQEPTDPIAYRGSVCWEELNSLKNCLLSDDIDENSNPLVITTDSERDAELALLAVDTFASPECAVEVKPFLCLYFFGLMSNMDALNRVYYQPSAGHCRNLQNNVCRSEGILARASGLELPDCDEHFPTRTEPCNKNEEGEG